MATKPIMLRDPAAIRVVDEVMKSLPTHMPRAQIAAQLICRAKRADVFAPKRPRPLATTG